MLKKFLSILSVLILVASCSGKTKEDLVASGQKMIKEGNPSGAIVLFKNALDKDPNFFDARYHLAKAYMQAGKFEQAGQEYQKLIRMNPSQKNLRLELSKANLSSNKIDDALNEVNHYLESEPVSAEALEIQGYALAAKGDSSGAERSMLKAIELDPGRSSAKLGLAGIYVKSGKSSKAQELLDEVIDNDSRNIKAYYMLAGLQISMNHRDKALETYKKIREINPSESEALYRSGLIYIDSRELNKADLVAADLIKSFGGSPSGYVLKGIISYFRNDLSGAMTSFQESMKKGPTLGAYYFLGMTYYQKGENELALSQFQRVLDANPSNVQSRLFISLIHLRQKRIDSALDELKKVIKDDPDNAFAHNLIGSAYLQKGMNEEGIRELGKAIQLDPKLVEAHVKKGMFYISKGNFKEAETDLTSAVRVAPEVVNTRLILASYYLHQRDYQKAVSTLRDGLTGSKSDAALYNVMASAQFRQKKPAEALTSLQKAKQLDPDYFDPYYNIALYYIVGGEYDKALAEYNAVLHRNPKDVRALVSIAMLLELQGKDGQAASYYASAKETKETAAYLAHSSFYMRKNDTQNALSVLDDLLRLKPNTPEALDLKGKILFNAQRYKEALQVSDQLESISPYRGMPLIINTYIAMKDYPSAIKRIENKLSSDPSNISLRADLAKVYVLMGDENKAVESANKIIDPWNNSATGYIVLASVYERLKKLDQAIETMKKGIQVDSKNIDARLKIGGLYAQKKEYPAAIKSYELAAKLNPRAVRVYFEMGTVYEKMGKGKDAVRQYHQALEKSEDYFPAMNNLAFLYLQGYGSKEEALDLAIKSFKLAPQSPEIMDTLGYALVKNNRGQEALKLLQKASTVMPRNPTVMYHLALAYKETGYAEQARQTLTKALSSGDFPEAKEARSLLERLE